MVLALAAVMLSGVAEGIAQAVASLVTVLLVAAAVVALVAVAGIAVLVAYRVHRKRSGGPPRVTLVPAPVMHERATPKRERAALEAPKPQVINFFGVTPDQVADILRQQSVREGVPSPDPAGISRAGSVPTTSDQDAAGRWAR